MKSPGLVGLVKKLKKNKKNKKDMNHRDLVKVSLTEEYPIL
jgi:hypothetical protein